MNAKFILAATLSLAILVVFVSLGTWQLQRMTWKAGVLAEIEQVIAGPVTPLPAMPDESTDKYRPVALVGDFTGPELHVLVSSRDLGAGFRVVQGFDLKDENRRVMVDRGFVPVRAKTDARATGAAEVTGNIHWPDDRDDYTPPNDPAANYWYARDIDEMAAALDAAPVLILARSPTDPSITPLPVTTEGIPNRHLEYVGTWFLLAITWSVMTGFALWRMKRRTQDADA